MFEKVNTKPDFPVIEKGILKFWQDNQIFKKLVEKNKNGPKFIFYDGPMTANNPMGVHHAWGRTYKDVYQRYKAMKGCCQRYQNGFDCQGLWVEVEVEKELGLNSKRDIESYGLANFSKKCRERVERCSGVQAEQSMRLGQWMHWDNSYYTMTDTNIEHIWLFLKTCFEKGWLYKGYRAMPWCIRCGTSLSQHELIDSYREMRHTSVFIKLPIKEFPSTYILVWTTTPWTLSSNTALAVHPDLEYVKVKHGPDTLILCKGALGRVFTGSPGVIETVKGKDLVGLTYDGPFSEFEAQKGYVSRIVAWKDVGEAEGTGVVHIAPGCGAEDYDLGKTENLKVIVPIDDNGIFFNGFGFLSGRNVSTVAEDIFAKLKEKGYLFKTELYTHRYPVCWRCDEELVFKLVDEWFISCKEIKPVMIRESGKVKWIPDYAGKRMEDWLNNMGDWCISRKRYWGLPLPFYICSCGQMTVIGSKEEFASRAVSGMEQLKELHKPWIDNVRIRCSACGAEVSRITEVGDCWLDAGIIPFSTLNYLSPDRAYWREWFPADFICEMREQIRLWFYSLLFMGVTLEEKAPYRCVLVYEKVYDEKGEPMHKSAGNAIWFDDAVEKMGADIMRWIYASQNIETNLRFGFGAADEVKRKMLTLWNVYSFFTTYANLDKPDISNIKIDFDNLPLLDRWLISKLNILIRDVNSHLENYDAAWVTKNIENFIDELSNWYVRRSRRRFWKSESDTDKASAYATLYYTLTNLIKLAAPVIPFSTEDMYQNLVRGVDPAMPESVHLCDYPTADEGMIDDVLIKEMDTVIKVTSLALSARNSSRIKVRQPLPCVYVYAPQEERPAIERFKDIILDEINVKALEFFDNDEFLMSYKIKPNLSVVGPKYGKLAGKIKEILEKRVEGLSSQEKSMIEHGSGYPINVDREVITLDPSEILIESKTHDYFEVAQDVVYRVALDKRLTDEFIKEGMARDLVRLIQNMRKEAGFNVEDKIIINYNACDELRDVIDINNDYIRAETLAVKMEASDTPKGEFSKMVKVQGKEAEIAISRI